ncbi:NAD(P)-binding domain-containing protein [Kitasatospora sp. A2-31]|uniref:NAD(P)-dependent oxidoreductase n=1 Tax=Kitasatospora sp. A2-31 TaxID=2916414 RepID=UPI001EEBD021|nr:NAD(P)-binding domain-containing protein [Kitasatospora sp. A2-31]MCG6495829.1 NAD(P)-binding domain-containing protein [Kitasatospora sp. A2-31]
MNEIRSSSTSDSPTPVTVLGLGPMGRALAAALLTAGHRVTVWNRTPGREAELLANGAGTAADAAEAVAASPLTLLCVRDHDAVTAVRAGIADALRGRTLVSATSVAPDQARETAAWAAEHDVRLLNAAILTPTATIGGPNGVIVCSGDAEPFHSHRPTLAALAGTVDHLGTDPGRAAAYDAALLDLFWTTVHGCLHAFALARAEGIAATRLAPYAQGLPRILPALIDGYAQCVDTGDHPGDRSNVASAAAGLAHVAHTARARGLDTGVLDAALAVTERAVATGHAAAGVSALAEVLGGRPPRT